ncbi:MAG: DNA methylase [Bacteroidia bacterium]|nr:MAG: DNA methylase [Bacteroidia bacterium]
MYLCRDVIIMIITQQQNHSLRDYLSHFSTDSENNLFSDTDTSIRTGNENKTFVETIKINNNNIYRYTNEFWTSKQRQANALHEISYRACFKPQLPAFFIKLLTRPKDVVYDPFAGRGTTPIEAALLNRNIIANDVNPLSRILTEGRLYIPELKALEKRLKEIEINYELKADIDLSMFYHPKTEAEIVSLRKYLIEKKQNGTEDELDKWIRMVATNRLTGHSANFFSVYTLPPNQSIKPEKQKKINEIRKQQPEYKDTFKIILKKSIDLMKDITPALKNQIRIIADNAIFLNKDARHTSDIPDDYVHLTVTSPPFLDIVQYADDNWLRLWFNDIDKDEVSSKITMSKTINEWEKVMNDVFKELYRITKKGGYVAFEVGEVKNGKIKLDEIVAPIGIENGFVCEAIMINKQVFTKTANIWGIKNNAKGTNTNRIVIFKK